MSNVSAQPIAGTHPVIMFVDDEQRVLKSMRAMFRRDYEVLLANSGAQALQLLQNHSHRCGCLRSTYAGDDRC